jgi:hypothetical protein
LSESAQDAEHSMLLYQRHCESRGGNARRTVAFKQNLGADSGGSLVCVYGHASARGCDRKANGPHQRVILHAMKRSYWVSTTSANCVCMVDATRQPDVRTSEPSSPRAEPARFASQERPVRPFSSARLYELVPIGKALTRRLCYLTALRNLTNNMA